MPAGDGELCIAGEVNYQTSPVTIQLRPGVLAKSIRLTDEMTDSWLKDFTPTIMRIEKLHGTVGAEIDEATIVVGAPEKTRVTGRLLIHHFQMALTPLMKKLVATVEGMHAIASGTTRNLRDKSNSLIVMPTQSVDFDMNLGLIKHKQSVFKIGETNITCSGYVTLGGRLAMIAKIPKKRGSAPENSDVSTQDTVSVPISGTVDRPVLDPTGLMRLTTLMTNRTVFESVGKVMQEQIDSSELLFESTAKMLGGGEVKQDDSQTALDKPRRRTGSRETGAQESTIR